MTTDEKLDLLSAQMGAMMQRFDQVEARVADLRAEMNQRFERVDARFDNVSEYILDFRSEAIRRFDQVEARLDMVIVTVQSLDARVPALTKAVLELQKSSQRPAA